MHAHLGRAVSEVGLYHTTDRGEHQTLVDHKVHEFCCAVSEFDASCQIRTNGPSRERCCAQQLGCDRQTIAIVVVHTRLARP